MCAPAAMVLTGISTLMGMQSARQQASAQAAMYNQQAAVAEQNARISASKQRQINAQYLQEKEQMDDKMRLVAGQNAAEAGSSSLMMTGTPLQSLGAAYDAYNQDVNKWDTNKNNAIWNEKVNETNYLNQANASRSAAANAKRQGNMQALATLISGAASMYSLKQQYAGAPKNTGTGNTARQNGYTSGSNANSNSYQTVKRDTK